MGCMHIELSYKYEREDTMKPILKYYIRIPIFLLVYLSIFSGITYAEWHIVSTHFYPEQHLYYHYSGISFLDDNYGLSATHMDSSIVSVTYDGGVSWEGHAISFPDWYPDVMKVMYFPYEVQVLDRDTALCLDSFQSLIEPSRFWNSRLWSIVTATMSLTKDGGLSWDVLFEKVTAYSANDKRNPFVCIYPNLGATGARIITTADGFSTTHDTNVPYEYGFAFDIDMIDEKNGAILWQDNTDGIGASLIVYQTDDGGVTWNRLFDSKPGGLLFRRIMYCPAEGTVWLRVVREYNTPPTEKTLYRYDISSGEIEAVGIPAIDMVHCGDDVMFLCSDTDRRTSYLQKSNGDATASETLCEFPWIEQCALCFSVVDEHTVFFGGPSLYVNDTGGDGWGISGILSKYTDHPVAVDSHDTSEITTPSITVFPPYPNPFNPMTTIKFSVSSTQIVSVNIYNINGCKVKTLLNNTELNTGIHEVTFNGQGLANGIYFYKISTQKGAIDGKILLLK